MKNIITLLFSAAILIPCIAQKNTGLSPVFKFGAAATEYDKTYGFINETGKLVIPYTYEHAGDFREGFSLVMKNGKYGYVDESGKLVIPCEYSYAVNFNQGIAVVEKDEKRFYIDHTGKKLAGNTTINGITQIEVNDRYGFTGKNGELIIPADYNYGYDIFGNYIVCRNGEMNYIFDSLGKKILETGARILDIENSYVIMIDDSKYGVMDFSGNLLFQSGKTYLYHYYGDYFFTETNNVRTYYDKSGNVVEKPKTNDGSAYIESEIVKGSYYANIYDATGALLKTYLYDPGVEGDDLEFIHGLARIHLMKEDPTSKDEMVRDWGGVQAVYVNMKGEIIWKSDIFYSCFPAEALITMADKTKKKISEIKSGDLILSFDFISQKETTTLVEEVMVHSGNYDLNEITAANADHYFADLNVSIQPEIKMSATPNHPVHTATGTKTVSDLLEGDEIITLDQNGNILTGKVIGNEKMNNTASAVYNLKTKSSCYFVNGMLVMMK